MPEEPYVDEGPGTGPPEALVLDIGGDIGAIVVYGDEALLGVEVDLSAAGAPRSHHVHTMIRRRRVAGGDVVVGVYPEVQAGDYTLWHPDDQGRSDVSVRGGEVIEVDLRTDRPQSTD